MDSEDEDAEDVNAFASAAELQNLRLENEMLHTPSSKKVEDKALYLAKTLLLVHGLVKPPIDRTAEAAVLCKEATKDRAGALERIREFYKEIGAKVQAILTSGVIGCLTVWELDPGMLGCLG